MFAPIIGFVAGVAAAFLTVTIIVLLKALTLATLLAITAIVLAAFVFVAKKRRTQ